MKNTLLILILLLFGCKNQLSEADQKRIFELQEKASVSQMEMDLESAKAYYLEILEIDPTRSDVLFDLIRINVEQDSIDQAFKNLENLPPKQKETLFYHQMKGGLYESNNQTDQALEHYKKAFQLTKKPKVKDEMDLMKLVDYTMLQTVVGQKDEATLLLNQTLELQWLTESNRDYLSFIRNECEYYQDKGFMEFNPTNDLVVKTDNSDSLKVVLDKNHINISGSQSSGNSGAAHFYFSEKYRSGLNALGLEPEKLD